MPTTPRPMSRSPRAAATALGVAALLAACTPPDGGAGPALDPTVAGSDGGSGTPADQTPTVPAEASAQSVSATDGSETWVSAGSTELLAEVPVDIPLVAGDADLVQVSGGNDAAARTYYVVITSPGSTAVVWSTVADEFAEAGFRTEDTSPDEGQPVAATVAAIFSGNGRRVTVGLAPAGHASTTVTYLIVPAG